MAKKKVEKPRRELTKRQLSRWQQQERRRRLIFGLGILIVVAVIGIPGVGYLIKNIPEYKTLHETVIEVNGTKFNMDYYVKMLKWYYGMGMPLEELTDNVVKIIQRNELVRQEAAKMGYSVSDKEVQLVLEGYNLPLKKDYWDVIRVDMIGKLLMDNYFDKQVPTQAEQRHILAMFLESEEQANEVRARLEAGEDFAQLAGELSLDTTAKEKNGDLGWRPRGALSQFLGTSVIDEFAFSAGEGEVSQPLYDAETEKKAGYWLIKVLDKDESGAPHVHPILLGSKEQAEEIKARAEAGEDYDTLQGEYTLDQATRCLYGLEAGTMSAAFDEYVFDPELELETISEPIRDDTVSTKGGYWLVKVVGIESKQISAEDRDLLKANALAKWADALFDDPKNKVISYLDEDKKNWALGKVLWG